MYKKNGCHIRYIYSTLKEKVMFFFHVQKKCEKKEITFLYVNKIYNI